MTAVASVRMRLTLSLNPGHYEPEHKDRANQTCNADENALEDLIMHRKLLRSHAVDPEVRCVLLRAHKLCKVRVDDQMTGVGCLEPGVWKVSPNPAFI
jgi:hypothetical protein